MFNRKLVLSEEEQAIKEIIILMLDNTKTLIEINPDDMSYLISDEQLSYFLEIDSVGVKITNHAFMLDKRMSSNVIDVLKNIIATETTKRRIAKKEIIFKNGIELLNKIKNTLNENL